MVRISLEGQRTQFSSQLTVSLNNWDAKGNIATGNSTRTQEINDELRDIRSALTFHYREIKRHESFVTVFKVRDAYLGIGLKMKMLLEVFENYNDELEKLIGNGISKSVVNKYKLTKNRLQEFVKHQFNSKDIAIRGREMKRKPCSYARCRRLLNAMSVPNLIEKTYRNEVTADTGTLSLM